MNLKGNGHISQDVTLEFDFEWQEEEFIKLHFKETEKLNCNFISATFFCEKQNKNKKTII